jgi:hypothetical protein
MGDCGLNKAMDEKSLPRTLSTAVTPEMVEAGICALMGHDPGWDDRETVIRIFRAMVEAQETSAHREVSRGIAPPEQLTDLAQQA